MNKATVGAAVVTLIASAGAALASDISTVNGYNVQLRQFNDFPTSQLTYGPAGSPTIAAPVPITAPLAPFGAGVEFLEQFPAGTPGNFANRHVALFSNDGGATPFGMDQHQNFTVNVDVRMTGAAGDGSRKEGGLKFFNNRGGGFIDEGEIMVASENGEVAAFGANLSFFTFGAGTYTPGQLAHLTFNYFGPGVNSFYASYQIIFTDPVTGVHNSGILDFDHGGAVDPTNPANGFNSGSTLGFLDQNQRNPTINDFGDAFYGNPTVVPTPGAAALLGLGGLLASRRRR
jgi:MYXO-CTERM domain-containing protein